jgi:hypothetical protein
LEASLSSMLEVQTGKALLGHEQMGNDLWWCKHDGSTNAMLENEHYEKNLTDELER